MRSARLLVVCLVLGPGWSPPAFGVEALGPDDCVAVALERSGEVREADGHVALWRARLAEVESIFYPKLSAVGFLAPMYRVHGGPDDEVTRDLREWGPYTHLEAVLAQPIYTFGRGAAGKRAASERLAVEEARARRTRQAVALEVRRLYYLHLFARSMEPVLEGARRTLDTALESARAEYSKGTGVVTNVDLQKLVYGSAELERHRVKARVGAELSRAALAHTMGLPQETDLVLAHSRLPDAPSEPLPSYEELLTTATAQRPEWQQVRHGREAAVALERSERLADAPVLFVAGQLEADWTPMRHDAVNPFDYDPHNQLVGGIALGLTLNLDPARSAAKAEEARALGEQVEGLADLAATGIPLEVRVALDNARQAEQMLALGEEGLVAARKWFIFAGAALAAGTGEAKDVLEGLVAYVTTAGDRYEALREVHTSRSRLRFAVGAPETVASPGR